MNHTRIARITNGKLGSQTGCPVKTILVVEDDGVVLELICAVLLMARYRVLHATNFPAVVAQCRKRRRAIDLAILDVIMPGRSGPELLSFIRKRFPGVRVLYMSGYLPEQIAAHGVHTDDQILMKPFTPATLLKRVTEVLSQSRRTDEWCCASLA